MSPGIRLGLGAPVLLAGAAIAVAGGLGPAPDWLGWILLLPGIVLVAPLVPRRVLEPLAISLLVAGGIMNCQPHLIAVFRWNTAVLVVAAALFTVASHLRDDGREATRAGRRLQVGGGALLALGGLAALQPWWPALALPGIAAVGAGVVASVAAGWCARRAESA